MPTFASPVLLTRTPPLQLPLSKEWRPEEILLRACVCAAAQSHDSRFTITLQNPKEQTGSQHNGVGRID